jgi:hypothetical protein
MRLALSICDARATHWMANTPSARSVSRSVYFVATRPSRAARRGPAPAAGIIVTDDWPAYNGLDRHFISHSWVNQSAGVYVEGDTHTNAIEGFFGHVKPAIRGTYRKVSHHWLQGYLNEFCWRYNLRDQRNPSMFAELVKRVTEP